MYKIVDVDPDIYRGYDLRGLVGSQLNDDVYYTLGRGYATFLAERRITETAVGRDNRLNSESFAKAFIVGLNEGGIDTFDIGHSLSQITYFSAYEFKTKGSAMVTASHNPREFNGLKLGVGYSDTMITDEIQHLRKIVEGKKFSEGSGKNVEQDIFPDYLKDIEKHFNLKKKWKVLVDACNTTSGLFYPEVFRAAGCEVIEKNTNLDGNFPLGTPDPTEKDVLDRVSKDVIENKVDIGFAYDSDGDRMAVVDETGQVFWMDSIVAIFAKDVLDYLPGSPIVFNALCSKQVKETIESHGGIPIMWKTGHSFIKAKVKEARAPFGGELSGHIFFMDNFYGHDDGAYASLRLLQYLERKNQSLSQAAAELPHYTGSPEIKLGMADSIKFQFVDATAKPFLNSQFPDAEFSYIDGVRMDTKTEMIVIRASQNGPYITIKFEAKDQEDYNKLKVILSDFLKQQKDIDWNAGVNTHAFE